ncbi:amidoligase family protein [Synechococcus sp. MIT S9451]|uniref:amidoligase family protein n=1 Tax=Synechococcus sp. MIT S9451 TaxID=3082543 RepID=UPI0039B6E834
MITNHLRSRIGFEVELIAPKGLSRRNLADAIARLHNGEVIRFFHAQAEPIKLPDTPIFENLTLGFKVIGPGQKLIALCVDDLTLQSDLDKSAASKEGWYRIVSDDARFLELVVCQCDAELPIKQVLTKLAHLYRTDLQVDRSGMCRVVDQSNHSIAIAAPLPGERERACELVTAPIKSDHHQQLSEFLCLAKDLAYTIPVEGATHLHFEALSFHSAQIIKNIVNLFDDHDQLLRRLFKTNIHCTRLGQWPQSLFNLVAQPSFTLLAWPEAKRQLQELPITKYCNYNLANIIHEIKEKPTFEVRILPSSLEALDIINAACVVEALLTIACSSINIERLGPVGTDNKSILAFLNEINIDTSVRDFYCSRFRQ